MRVSADWRLAANLLRREWRSGDVRLLLAALVLAVAVVSGLTAFTQRLHTMLQGEAAQMLAADRILEAPRPVPEAWLQEAAALSGASGRQSRFVQFQSMLYPSADSDEALLVSAKAADSAYPLLGQVQYRQSPNGPLLQAPHGPPAGEAWVEARVLQQLGIALGSVVELGDAELKVSAVLVAEPDRGAGSFSLGPRLLMHWDDVPQTGVVQLGSRIDYRYLFSADAAALAQLDAYFKTRTSENQRWQDLAEAQPRLASSLDRAEQFLLLASSVVVLLAGVALAMTAAQFAQRQMRLVAVLKTLGAGSGRIQALYARFLLLLGAGAAALALLLGWALQAAALAKAEASLGLPPPPLSVWPFALGLAVAALSLTAFVGPALAELRQVSALLLLQERQQSLRYFSLGKLLLALLGLMALLLLYTRAPLLAGLLLAGLLGVLAAIALPTAWLLGRLRQRPLRLHSAWGLAWSNLLRRLRSNAVHMALFAISAMLALVLWGMQQQLFSQWQTQLPEDAPNYFVLNIEEDHLPAAHQWLKERGLDETDMYPIIRARLVAINGQPVGDLLSEAELDKAGVNRELNLSWAEQLPPDNTLLAGQWWHEGNRANGVSIESRLAERLGVGLGDELALGHEGQRITARISSIRQLDWEAMRPNFFLLFTPEQLWDYPKTYMSSFYLPPERQSEVAEFLRQFPTAIVIDLEAVTQQIRSLMGHVALALQWVLALVLLGSVLVFISTVQSGLAERQYENTVLRALGLSQQRLRRALWLEFALLGLLSGLLASVLAQCVLLAVQQQVFELPLRLFPQLWWPAPLGLALLLGLAGYTRARRISASPPMQALRASL